MRTTVEHSITADPRYQDLILKLGNRWAALGAITELWMFAQKFHTIENAAADFPHAEWKKARLCDAIIEVDLAHVVDGVVKIRGGLECFKGLTSYKMRGRSGGESKAQNAALLSSAKAQLPASTPLISTLCSLEKEKKEVEGTPPVKASPEEFEKVVAEIPKVTLDGWSANYEKRDIVAHLRKAFDHYTASGRGGRTWAEVLVAWVNRENHLKPKRKPVAPRSETPIEPPAPNTSADLERARHNVARFNLKLKIVGE